NDTDETLRRLDLAYVGEQWRLAGGDLADGYTVEFRTAPFGAGSLDAPGGWTPLSALTFNAPRTGSSTTALDGRAAANRASIVGIVAPILWSPGEELWLRWTDAANDGSGNRRHLIALNSVSVRASRGLELTGFASTPEGLRLEWDSAGQPVAVEESTDLEVWTRIATAVTEPFFVRPIPTGEARYFLRAVLDAPGAVQPALPGLVAFWGFSEPAGSARVSSVGGHTYRLIEAGGPIETIAEGPVSGAAIRFSGNNYLTMPRSEFVDTPLDRKGPGARVSLVVWARRQPKTVNATQLEFLGGPWDEDGLRQYGLFINESNRQKTTAHVSNVGVGTGSGEFNTSFARGLTSVPFHTWITLGLTYDGGVVRVYYNGVLDGTLPFTGDLYDPENAGKTGSDFTLGANWAKGALPAFVIRNHFKGDVGGLAVYDRALTESEMRALHPTTP
ncbi:MAG: LamG domain-containing protein, partial [Burkholderiales bacterium]|nr:LamG domain-containing protein [Opitutaceae bacterium]